MNSHAGPRPVVSIPRTGRDIALQGIALLGLVGQFAVTAWYWSRLPERIPTHFGFDGQPDRWGSRATILALPIASTAIVLVLSVLERFPHTYNYAWPITPENAPRQYALARGMLVALKAVLCWLFLAILVGTCRAATGGGGLSGWIPTVGVGVVFALIGGYLAMARRAR
jgi:uncharacterized membrane protein